MHFFGFYSFRFGSATGVLAEANYATFAGLCKSRALQPKGSGEWKRYDRGSMEGVEEKEKEGGSLIKTSANRTRREI